MAREAIITLWVQNNFVALAVIPTCEYVGMISRISGGKFEITNIRGQFWNQKYLGTISRISGDKFEIENIWGQIWNQKYLGTISRISGDKFEIENIRGQIWNWKQKYPKTKGQFREITNIRREFWNQPCLRDILINSHAMQGAPSKLEH